MFFYLIFSILIGFTAPIEGISIKIGGSVNLGPDWKLQLPLPQESKARAGIITNKKTTKAQGEVYVKLHEDDRDNEFVDYKKKKQKYLKLKEEDRDLDVVDNKKENDKMKSRKNKKQLVNSDDLKDAPIFIKPRFLKNDTKIQEFNAHVYKQALAAIEQLKKKISVPFLRHKIDYVSDNYKMKFKEYLNVTRNQKIRTRVGYKKVVLNTVDTSHRILNRLINYLVAKLDQHGNLRTDFISANTIKREIDAGKQLEYNHVCKKFGICRTMRGFIEFVMKILSEILRNHDEKVKKAADSLIETTEELRLQKWLESNTIEKLSNMLKGMMNTNGKEFRIMFMIIKKVLAFRNQPIHVYKDIKSNVVNRTIAFLDLMDILDDAIISDEENKLAWQYILNSLREWTEGEREDIVDICREIWVHVKKKGLKKLTSDKIKKLTEDLNLLVDDSTNKVPKEGYTVV